MSKAFPKEETYSLTDQIRRSSRSVCANIAEAWRKRRYPLAFVSKLSDSEAEAAETQTWLQFAVKCGYLSALEAKALYKDYDAIIGMLVSMITHRDQWKLIITMERTKRLRTGVIAEVLSLHPSFPLSLCLSVELKGES